MIVLKLFQSIDYWVSKDFSIEFNLNVIYDNFDFVTKIYLIFLWICVKNIWKYCWKVREV